MRNCAIYMQVLSRVSLEAWMLDALAVLDSLPVVPYLVLIMGFKKSLKKGL